MVPALNICLVHFVQDGFGTANTALIYHANKLLALHEGDLPYAVSPLLLLFTLPACAPQFAAGHTYTVMLGLLVLSVSPHL